MDANEFAKTTQSLGMRYLEEYTRGMQRYADLLNSMARSNSGRASGRGIMSPVEQQNRYSEFVLKEAPKVIQQLSTVSMNYYASIADLGIQTLNRYFEEVVQGQASKSDESTSQDSPESMLVFHGTRNEDTSNAFLLSNHRSVEIEVAFDVTDVVSQDGESRFKPRAVFTPGKCTLAPHSEKVVQCTLTLSDKFKKGQQYRGSISVVGFPEMSMPFSVDIEESPEPTKASKTRKKATAKKTAGTKKRVAKRTGKKSRKKTSK